MDKKLRTAAIKRMKVLPMFAYIKDNEEALELIAEKFKIIRKKAGRDIVTEGEEGDTMFILNSGSVSIRKHTFEADPYTVISLHASSHVVFGEQAMLDSDKRSATVKAETDCELFAFDRKGFRDLSRTHPDYMLPVLVFLAKELSQRLRKANQDIITLFEALVNEIREES
ncbi:cyclic nucleotide-binding domain-containing protein [Candidatus Riflebacteria bacterium]